MPKKMKLDLESLKVKSFTTGDVKGGQEDTPFTDPNGLCPDSTTPNCNGTYDICTRDNVTCATRHTKCC